MIPRLEKVVDNLRFDYKQETENEYKLSNPVWVLK